MSTDTIRASMSTDEMLARFARINNLDLIEATGQFEDTNAKEPRLLAAAHGNSMADEAGDRDTEAPMRYHNEVFLDQWRKSHSVARHSGNTWSSGWSDLNNTPLFRSLVTILRLRDKRGLAKFYRAWDLAEARLGSPGRAPRRFGDYCDHPRAFASLERPRVLAGITMTPYMTWDWNELEGFASFLRSEGLDVRIGLAEDQWYNGATTPIVIWNPALVDVPYVGPLGER